jgi:hypothetical protein
LAPKKRAKHDPLEDAPGAAGAKEWIENDIDGDCTVDPNPPWAVMCADFTVTLPALAKQRSPASVAERQYELRSSSEEAAWIPVRNLPSLALLRALAQGSFSHPHPSRFSGSDVWNAAFVP